MDKFVYYGLLFNIYSSLFNENTINIFSLYYEENLTLQEIADNLGVSKSYIGNVIKKTQKKLDELESNLNIYKNKEELKNVLELKDTHEIKKKIETILNN